MSDWTDGEIQNLCELRAMGKGFSEIGRALGRTTDSVKSKYNREAFRGSMHPRPDFPDLAHPEVDIDEWLEGLSAIQTLSFKARPQTIVADVRIETGGKPIAFTQTSCWHLGGLYTVYPRFRECLESLLEIDRLYWGSLGDEWEGFPPNWANTVFNNLIPPATQKALVWKVVEKLAQKGKLLYSCWSNHPAFIEKLTGEDQSAPIFTRAGVPYFNGRGILKLFLDGQRYIFDLAHTFKGRSMYNPNHPQSREFRSFPFADFVISGGLHEYAYQEHHVNAMACDAGLAENRMARLISVGTMKTLPDPYTVRNFQRSQWTFSTWPTFLLSAKEHKIHRVEDLEALKWYLGRDDF